MQNDMRREDEHLRRMNEWIRDNHLESPSPAFLENTMKAVHRQAANARIRPAAAYRWLFAWLISLAAAGLLLTLPEATAVSGSVSGGLSVFIDAVLRPVFSTGGRWTSVLLPASAAALALLLAERWLSARAAHRTMPR
jgi:hypothetical protein